MNSQSGTTIRNNHLTSAHDNVNILLVKSSEGHFLYGFNNMYCSWFESYHRNPIPLISWTPTLISLFDTCKINFITSPLLLRYDSSKPVFRKTY